MFTTAVVVLVVVGLSLGGVLAVAGRRPDRFRVERSIVIVAAPERVFPWIADLRAWGAWSPYDAKDPAMTRRFEGPPSGVGAAYAWSGNNKAGAGRMEVTEVAAPSRLVVDLVFTRPFKAHNAAGFDLVPEGTGTAVTWWTSGPSPLAFKLMSLFADMDRMIGRDFEVGLAALKRVAEAA